MPLLVIGKRLEILAHHPAIDSQKFSICEKRILKFIIMAISCLQTLQLEHLPPGYVIHIALYKDLQNADFLQKQLLEGNTAYEYALIDASVVSFAVPS